MTESQDDPQVARAISGDLAALEALLREYEPDIRRSLSIQPLWSRSFDVDDVLQVSYLEAFMRIRSLRKASRESFLAWMKTLATNNVRDAIRALERDRRPDAKQRVTHGGQGESARTLLSAVVGQKANASSHLALHEELSRLDEAVKSLPETYRRVIEEVDLAERPVSDVAEAMGRSPGAVHMIRARAHSRLQEILGSPPH